MANQLFLIPPISDGWMPHEWAEQTRKAGGQVISGARSRAEYLDEVRNLLVSIEKREDNPDEAAASEQTSVDSKPEDPVAKFALTEDFLAFGICWLMVELLTRKMHYYSSLDDTSIERDTVAAAEAARAGDETATRSHLKGAFETLLESREHFYPVDCYLLDICLMNPESLTDHLSQTLDSGLPMNVLVKAEDLNGISQKHPELFGHLKEAIRTGQVDIIGGDRYEKPISLLTIQSLIWDLKQGHEIYRQLAGCTPRTWARKRFGFSTQLPQILEQFGYHSALHIALDDGLYPDEEQSKLRWEGCDGTVIDAVSRIPLAAEGAMSFLRFPDRMAESMQDDQVAGILFARWPEVKSPFLEDFRRVQNYAPVLGKFSTFEEYIQTTDHSGRLSRHNESEYLSPYFLQSVAYEEKDGGSRYPSFLARRHLFDRAAWFSALRQVLSGVELTMDDSEAWEDRIERSGPDLPEVKQETDSENLLNELHQWDRDRLEQLSKLLVPQSGSTRGLLLVNSLAHSRTTVVSLAGFEHLPVVDGEKIKAVQADRNQAVVEVP
ncbi:MAG TPA: hypothetical protein VLA12_21010, partial [Planctomycetaceae bacterium]|nr:hypothetical protein [Planctomycetaceae bacterium]